MRILFLTQIVPYPPDAGPKVKTWHVLRALSQFGHEITLVTFVRKEEEEHLVPLQDICKEVYSVHLERSRLADIGYWIKSHITGRPFLVERDDLPEMRAVISNLLSNEKFDAIHADQLTMAQFAFSTSANGSGPQTGNRPTKVFDAHNAVWTIVKRMSENARWFLRPVFSIEKSRIKRFEGKMVCEFDHTLAVISPDKDALLEAAQVYLNGSHPSIQVLPIAVDTEEVGQVVRSPNSMNIMTLGTLHYPPNADGIRWFLNEVFPIIHKQNPDTTFTIIGKNPPPDFLDAASGSDGTIEVTGYVPDLTPYYERAGVVVIPVRAGGGMRVRILESLSRGVPIVTTTIGLEGIEAMGNRDIIIADTAEDSARAVCAILNDPQEQERLGRNGRALAVEHYDWKVVLEELKSLYPNQSANPTTL